MRPLRVVLVDDNPAFIASVEFFLSTEPRVQVVGRAANGPEAIKEVARTNPDLVLLDYAMPGMDGAETTRVLKEQPHPPRVVLLTGHEEGHHRLLPNSAGADAFIAKSEFTVEIVPLIDSLCKERGEAGP